MKFNELKEGTLFAAEVGLNGTYFISFIKLGRGTKYNVLNTITWLPANLADEQVVVVFGDTLDILREGITAIDKVAAVLGGA